MTTASVDKSNVYKPPNTWSFQIDFLQRINLSLKKIEKTYTAAASPEGQSGFFIASRAWKKALQKCLEASQPRERGISTCLEVSQHWERALHTCFGLSQPRERAFPTDLAVSQHRERYFSTDLPLSQPRDGFYTPVLAVFQYKAFTFSITYL